MVKHYISIFTRFRNEKKWLKEFIEYYLHLGVEHFYMVDHLSTDNPLEVLHEYVKRGLITYIYWGKELDKTSHANTFHEMGNHVINLSKYRTKWLFICDTDEFLVQKGEEDLISYLKRSENYPAIGFNWLMFGTSDVEEITPSDLLIEKMIRRATLDYESNIHVKCIVQPEKVKKYYIHHGLYKNGQVAVDASYNPLLEWRSEKLEVDKFAIHHYFLRDKKFMREVKIPRRKSFNDTSDILKLQDDLNAEEDKSLEEIAKLIKNKVIRL